MFDSITPRPRGFSGRPLVAFITVVGAGMLVYYLASWLRVSEVVAFVIIGGTVGIVGWVWYHLEGGR
jgi:hypothetical protein